MNTSLVILRQLCRDAGLPEPVAEWEFSGHGAWRADYAWPEYALALEVNGGAWVNGRHNRGSHTMDEHRKMNQYAMEGWRVIYTTPKRLLTQETVEMVRRALYA
jgi:hypothetical protein